MLISNHHQETVLLSRLLRHQEDEDKVTVVSSDGDNFRISRFVISFFSSYFHTDSFDVVLTPISSGNLQDVLHNLKLKEEQKWSDGVPDDTKLLGIDPEPIRKLPFEASVQKFESIDVTGDDDNNYEEKLLLNVDKNKLLEISIDGIEANCANGDQEKLLDENSSDSIDGLESDDENKIMTSYEEEVGEIRTSFDGDPSREGNIEFEDSKEINSNKKGWEEKRSYALKEILR